MTTSEKTGMFLNFTEQELAQSLAHNLKPLIKEEVDRVLESKTEDNDSPMTMEECADFIGISRATLAKIVGRGEIPFKSLNPDNPKSKKFFLKSDLRVWLQKNRTSTIDELRKVGNERSSN